MALSVLRRLSCAAVALFAAAAPLSAATQVDIDAYDDDWNNPVVISLAAGIYKVSLVEAAFTAWNAWGGQVSGCDVDGTNCAQGWLNQTVVSVLGTDIWLGDDGRYASAALAADAFEDATFALFVDSSVGFYNPDSWRYDNIGGVSLEVARIGDVPAASISSIPVPATLPLAAAGFAALGFLARRRSADPA